MPFRLGSRNRVRQWDAWDSQCPIIDKNPPACGADQCEWSTQQLPARTCRGSGICYDGRTRQSDPSARYRAVMHCAVIRAHITPLEPRIPVLYLIRSIRLPLGMC